MENTTFADIKPPENSDEEGGGSVFGDLDEDIDIDAAQDFLSSGYDAVVEAVLPELEEKPLGEDDAAPGSPGENDGVLTDATGVEKTVISASGSAGVNEHEKADLTPPPAMASPPASAMHGLEPDRNTDKAFDTPHAEAAEDADSPMVNLEIADSTPTPEIPAGKSSPVTAPSPAVWEDFSFAVDDTLANTPSNTPSDVGSGGTGDEHSESQTPNAGGGISAQPVASTWEEGMEDVRGFEGSTVHNTGLGSGLDALGAEDFLPKDGVAGIEGFGLEEKSDAGLDAQPAPQNEQALGDVVDLAPYLVASTPLPFEGEGEVSSERRMAQTGDATSSSSGGLKERPLVPAPPPPTETLDTLTRQMLLTTPQRLVVELGALELKGEEIMELGYGSVLRLNRTVGQMVDITLNGWCLAKGEIVLINDRDIGVRMVSVYSNPPKQNP